MIIYSDNVRAISDESGIYLHAKDLEVHLSHWAHLAESDGDAGMAVCAAATRAIIDLIQELGLEAAYKVSPSPP